MTYRNILTNIISILPSAELSVLGAVLTNAGLKEYSVEGDDEQCTLQKGKAITSLLRLSSPALDSYFAAPLFYIHMNASQRLIMASLARQVRLEKRRRGIKDSRLNTAKFDAYLKVWDDREGWTGKGYEISRRHSLKKLAKTHRKKLSTVCNQYKAAFEWITGQAYQLDIWVRIFGLMLIDSRNEDLSRLLTQRFMRLIHSRKVATVNETTLGGTTGTEDQAVGIVEHLAPPIDERDWIDMQIDLKDMIEKGRTNAEIRGELGVSDALIEVIRERLAEDI
jgi:hypothetical protein